MRNPLSPIFNIMFLLIMILLFRCSSGSDLLHLSCKNAAKSDPNFSYNFCAESLKGNPKSQTARNIEELFIISVELTISNATDVVSDVSKLLKDKKFDGYARSCLHDCLELYSDAVSSLKKALCDFTKSKDLYSADVEISSAMDASTTCEDGFVEKKGQLSPLTKDNNFFFQLTAISLAFSNMVHVGHK